MVILMHELAHKIGLPDEEFPDDRFGAGSEQNTLKIIQLCRDALKILLRSTMKHIVKYPNDRRRKSVWRFGQVAISE